MLTTSKAPTWRRRREAVRAWLALPSGGVKRVFVRDERPTWTIVVAVLLVPLGLLALAYRARSQVVVSAAADDSGVTAVDIYGTGPIAVRRAVRDHALAAG